MSKKLQKNFESKYRLPRRSSVPIAKEDTSSRRNKKISRKKIIRTGKRRLKNNMLRKKIILIMPNHKSFHLNPKTSTLSSIGIWSTHTHLIWCFEHYLSKNQDLHFRIALFQIPLIQHPILSKYKSRIKLSQSNSSDSHVLGKADPNIIVSKK